MIRSDSDGSVHAFQPHATQVRRAVLDVRRYDQAGSEAELEGWKGRIAVETVRCELGRS